MPLGSIVPSTHFSRLPPQALLPPHMKNRSPPSSRFTHNLPDETDLKERPSDPSYSYATPEGLRVDMKRLEVSGNWAAFVSFGSISSRSSVEERPGLIPFCPPPVAPFWEPEYLTLLSGPSSDASLASPSAGKEQQALSRCLSLQTTHTTRCLVSNVFLVPNYQSAGKEPLPGNPNVLLVSLQKLLSEETGQ